MNQQRNANDEEQTQSESPKANWVFLVTVKADWCYHIGWILDCFFCVAHLELFFFW